MEQNLLLSPDNLGLGLWPSRHAVLNFICGVLQQHCTEWHGGLRGGCLLCMCLPWSQGNRHSMTPAKFFFIIYFVFFVCLPMTKSYSIALAVTTHHTNQVDFELVAILLFLPLKYLGLQACITMLNSSGDTISEKQFSNGDTVSVFYGREREMGPKDLAQGPEKSGRR